MSQTNPYMVSSLLEKMSNPDTDFRFMATNDLTNELQKETFVLDEGTEKKMVAAVLKLMDDKNGEVQNLAVKCLGSLVRRVHEPQLHDVVDQLCNMSIQNKEALRDIASIGLKTVILELPAGSPTSANICIRLLPLLVKQLERKGTTYEVQMDTLDIITEVLSRFGHVLVQHAQLQRQIQNALVTSLSHSRPGIRKRASMAIGNLVAHISDDLFNDLVQNILANLQSSEDSHDKLRTYIQCVGTMSRYSSQRFGRYLSKLLPTVIKYSDEDDDELRENCLHTLESFVLRCPSEMAPEIPNVINICLKYLQYDPNYDAGETSDDESGDVDMGDGEEEDEEEETYSDDDDISWKVRRASSKVLGAIIGTRNELLPQLCQIVSPVLISRFKEREESVRVDIFQTYTVLLHQVHLYGGEEEKTWVSFDQIIEESEGARKRRKAKGTPMETDDSPKTIIRTQVPRLSRSIAKQLLSKSTQTRQMGFKLLRELVTVLKDGLENQLEQFIPAIESSLSTNENFRNSVHQIGTSSNLKIETLTFLRALFRSHSPSAVRSCLSKFCSLLASAVNDKFYKITAEALLACSDLVRLLRPLPEPGTMQTPLDPSLLPYVQEIYSATLLIVQTPDADQEVKERSIACIGILLVHCVDALQPELGSCLPVLLERLRNEVTRLIAIKTLTQIAGSNNVQGPHIRTTILEAVDEIAPLLRKSHRGLKVASAACLEVMVRRYGLELSAEQYARLLAELKPLISDSDLHLLPLALNTVVSVLRSNPVSIGSIRADILPPVFALVQSALVQGSALHSLLQLFGALVSANEADFRDYYDGLVKPVTAGGEKDQLTVTKQAYSTVAQCIATLCYYSPANCQKTVTLLADNIADEKQSSSLKYLSLLALGEVGRKVDLSSHVTIYKMLLNLLTAPSEEVKSAAAFALGNIAVGNVPKYLPVIINEVKSQSKRQYLLLHALKEIITRKANDQKGQTLEAYADEIWLLLFNNCESTEEGTRNVVAECLGKLTLTNPYKFLPDLKGRLKSTSAQTRGTVVTAIKYTFTDAARDYNELLRPLIVEFLSLMKDADLNVRRLSLSTLNSAAHNKPHLIRDVLGELLPLLYEETIIRPELIHTVEMGPFKHRVDDGLDIRKSAFECMYTLLDSCLDRIDIFGFLDRVIAGLNDQHEIKVLADIMLIRLASIAMTSVTQKLDDLVAPYKSTINFKVKQNAVKQEVEKNRELMRSALRAITALAPLSDAGGSPKFDEFLKEIKNGPLAAEFNSIAAESEHARSADYMDIA